MRLFRFNFRLIRAAGFSGQPWNRVESLTLVVFVAFAVLFLCGVVASAQLETGQIAGTVMDQTGAAVPNANCVSITGPATYASSRTPSNERTYCVIGSSNYSQ